MLGFAPLGSTPLASVGKALIVVSLTASATLGLTFGVGGPLVLPVSMSASMGLTFGSTAFATVPILSSASLGLAFNASPFLTLRTDHSATMSLAFNADAHLRFVGKKLVFVAMFDLVQFTAMADYPQYEADAQPFSFRGIL